MAGKTKMHNKKIASEIAIGITLLLAIIIGGIFWVQDRKQEALDVIVGLGDNQPVRRGIEKPSVQQLEVTANDGQKESQPVVSADKTNADACTAHLYEGEVSIKGSYVLETIPGSTKKEWMFKVTKDDLGKFPAEAKAANDQPNNDLLFIADATPDMTAKLKKATQDKPETITIKGFYLDCEGVPVVSIEPARLALAKYLKK